MDSDSSTTDFFSNFKNTLRDIDPVAFAENRIMLGGKPFKISNCGRKYLHDVYRYIAHNATRKDGKPVVIKKGRQVEATTMATNLDMFFMTSGAYDHEGHINVLHTFPRLNQTENYSKTKLTPLMEDSVGNFLKDRQAEEGSHDTLRFKRFANGNQLYIEASSYDADRLRNLSYDVAFFDEIQDTTQEAIDALTPALLHAKIGPVGEGVQVYFGTPKNRGSYFETLWDNSDQRHYYLGCANCNGHFLLYTPGTSDWEKTWISDITVQCPICHHRQTKPDAVERGKWVPTIGKENAPLVGFHFNQFLLPEMTKEAILKQKPIEGSELRSHRKWTNEVLGEFYIGGGGPLSFHDLLSNGADYDRPIPTYIHKKERPLYFMGPWMGIDWGGGVGESGKSLTTVVIISIDRAGRIIVEHAHKFDEKDWPKQQIVIEELWRRYSVQMCVADRGYGNIQIADLQRKYFNRVLGCWGLGNVKKPYKYDKDTFTITIFRDLLLDELADQLKKGNVRFPYQDPAKMEWLLEHCSSMDVETKTINRMVRQTWVKGSEPNDGFMALMYAFLAYKFKQTNGFTINKDIYGNLEHSTNLPVPRLAFMPKFK